MNDLEQFITGGAEILGSPRAVDTSIGPAIQYNGTTDAIILPDNPIIGLRKFSLELVFRPDFEGLREQRIFHLGESRGDRVLIETRLVGAGEWFLDTFISSGGSSCTLFNKETRHQLGKWYHLALVVDGRRMTNYVDGRRENRGELDFKPLTGGRTSIGVRLNRVCWFKGCFHGVRITPDVLGPTDFLTVEHYK